MGWGWQLNIAELVDRISTALCSLPVLLVNLQSLLHGPALSGLHDQGVFPLEGTSPESGAVSSPPSRSSCLLDEWQVRLHCTPR